jgi:hypothetical protein
VVQDEEELNTFQEVLRNFANSFGLCPKEMFSDYIYASVLPP